MRHVILDDKEVGSYSTGQYCYFYSSPGKHILSLKLAFVFGGVYPTAVTFAAGKTYYFDEANRFLPGMQLEQVDKNTAISELTYLQLNRK